MENQPPVAGRMEQIPFSGIRTVFEEALRREKKGETIIHLEVGRPDFDTPDHIKAACKAALDKGHVHYTSNFGLPELRAAVAEKLKADNGVQYDPDKEIIITCGVSEAIFMAMMALLNPGEEVLIPSPCFPAYRTAARMAGAVPREVELTEKTGFQPKASIFEDHITEKTRMVIINTPCNPTGAVYDRPTLEGLARLAARHDLLILSDEIYEKMVYDGAKHVSMAALPGMRERTLTMNGFSKNYAMTGWRIGYVAAPAPLLGAMVRIRQYITVCPVTFAQWGAVAALAGDQTCVSEMVAEFDRRRRLVCGALNSMNGIRINEPKGAFYALPNVEGLPLSPQKLCGYLMDRAKIAVVPWGERHIRISYANSYENLRIAMENMEQALGDL